MVVYALPGLAQTKKGLPLDDISDLIKNGVKPNRIAQLVEEHGVGFQLDDRALRRLKQDGANDTILAAVKKMSATYGEGSQQVRRRQQEDEARRKWEGEAKRGTEEQKPQQAEGTQEAARKVDETKRRAQEEAKQKSRRVNLLSREEVGRIASLQNVASTEKG